MFFTFVGSKNVYLSDTATPPKAVSPATAPDLVGNSCRIGPRYHHVGSADAGDARKNTFVQGNCRETYGLNSRKSNND